MTPPAQVPAPPDAHIHPGTDRSTLYMSLLMTPDLANFAGNVHGGALLKLLDQVRVRVREPLLAPLCGHPVGGPRHLPGADPGR